MSEGIKLEDRNPFLSSDAATPSDDETTFQNNKMKQRYSQR